MTDAIRDDDSPATKADIAAIVRRLDGMDRKLDALIAHLGVDAERANLATVRRSAGDAAVQPMAAKGAE